MVRRKLLLGIVFVTCCMSILSFVFLASDGFSQMSPVRAASLYPVQFTQNVSYGPYPEEVLDLCVPVGASAAPGILMIHGGGWVGGTRGKYDTMCQQYASEGYLVATMDYRLASKDLQNDPDHWPIQIGDAQLAVRFLRWKATQINLNIGPMCALGDSAGAHLALMLDELQTIHWSDVANIHPEISPTVQCVVDQFGPTDLRALYFENTQSQAVQQDIPALLGRDPYPLNQPDPVATDASPLDNIAPQTGPALIIQGTQDETVLPDQSTHLYQALQSDGIVAQFVSYNGGHEYSGLDSSQLQAIMDQINTYLNAQLQPGNNGQQGSYNQVHEQSTLCPTSTM